MYFSQTKFPWVTPVLSHRLLFPQEVAVWGSGNQKPESPFETYDEYIMMNICGTPVAHQVYTSHPASESISGLGNQTKLVTTMQLLPRGWTAIEEHSTLNHGGNWSAIYLMEYLMNIVPFQT